MFETNFVRVPTNGIRLNVAQAGPADGPLLIFLHGFIVSIWYGPAFAAAYSVSPGNMRATNSALLLFLGNLFGLGLAPLGVGLISDTLGASMGAGEGLRWALVILAMIGFLTAWLYWRSGRTLREDMVS